MGTVCGAACCPRRQRAGGTAGPGHGGGGDLEWEEPVDLRERRAQQQGGNRPQPLARAASQNEVDIVKACPTGEDCVICLQAIEEECARTICGHHFHNECLDKYLAVHRKQRLMEDRASVRARCPVCRTSLHLPLMVEASSSSRRPIEVVDVPEVGALCHFDRHYVFLSLGDFQRPGMYYLMTSNEDRRTPISRVMWSLQASRHVVVHLNFRSDDHASQIGSWLRDGGWRTNTSLRSTVSSGVPNGPYTGPVFSQAFAPGKIELMGSNTWEGVYFVFVEVVETPAHIVDTDGLPLQAATTLGTPTQVTADAEQPASTC